MTPKQMVYDLVENHPNLIRWLVQRTLRIANPRYDQNQFDDFRQDFVTYLLTNADRYDPEKGRLSTWANWQARGHLSKHLSEKKKRVDRQFRLSELTLEIDQNIPSTIPEPVDLVAEPEFQANLEKLFRAESRMLTRRQEEILLGHLLGSRSVRDLAIERKVNEQSIRERVRYCKIRLSESTRLAAAWEDC